MNKSIALPTRAQTITWLVANRVLLGKTTVVLLAATNPLSWYIVGGLLLGTLLAVTLFVLYLIYGGLWAYVKEELTTTAKEEVTGNIGGMVRPEEFPALSLDLLPVPSGVLPEPQDGLMLQEKVSASPTRPEASQGTQEPAKAKKPRARKPATKKTVAKSKAGTKNSGKGKVTRKPQAKKAAV